MSNELEYQLRIRYLCSNSNQLIVPKIKLRFGEVDTEESIPSFDAVADQIESNGIFGYEGNRRGVSMVSGADEYSVGEDYIFVRFVKEVSQEQMEIDDGDVVPGENDIARIMRFLLTRDGEYAYESTTGVYDNDALDYLIGEDSFDIGFEVDPYTRFTREQMRTFYEDAFRVRGLKLEDIGERGDVREVEDGIVEHVEVAGNHAVRAEFSTGQQDNHLGGPEILDGFAQLSDIEYIRRKDSEGEINEAYQTGRYVTSYPADLDVHELGERVRDAITATKSGLTREEEDD